MIFIHLNAHLNLIKYLLLTTNKRLRDTLVKFSLRACRLKNHKQCSSTREEKDITCLVCRQASEDEVHFLFQCQVCENLGMNYILISSTIQFSMILVSTLLASKDETEIKT